MICFLTSRTDIPETGELNPANGFLEELRKVFPHDCRGLYICSDPDSWDIMDYYASLTRESFRKEGFCFERFTTLDGRNTDDAEELVQDSDLILLAGGHVPTQNRFFQKIGLRRLMYGFDGIVIGISAGSMNSADIVYAHPEENGEATDPDYHRFLTGLGLTETMILPHYQEVKDIWLDGLHVFRDIACPDSMGRIFYALPDGSYLFIDGEKEELRGEAYRVQDGVITQISSDGEIIPL